MREPAFWWRRGAIQSRLLAPFAHGYGAIAARRMSRPGTRLSVPVVCVGNFTLGGAGKTPAAIALAKMLKACGEQPFFLSRGYGGNFAGPHRVNAQTDKARQVGDEALLLARVAPTIVARDRLKGAQLATTQGASVVVMDDGLQNPSLVKDFTLAVVDGRRGIGNGDVFPAGPLRAPLQAQLRYSDALLVVGQADGARATIATARACGLSVFFGELMPDVGALSDLKERRMLAFTGIGDPEKFFAAARALGLAIEECRAFPDHHFFTSKESTALIRNAEKRDLVLLTTEKDHARMRGEPLLAALAARAYVLPVRLVVKQEKELRQLLLTRTKRSSEY